MRIRIFFILFILLSASCSKDGDTIFVPDPNDMPKTNPLVTVVYDPDALGDRSYNDLIYQGVENAAMKHGLRTFQMSPSSLEEGKANLENMFLHLSQKPDTIRRLIIVTSQAYDAYIRENSSRLESNPYVDLLYLETNTPLASKGSTLFLQYYGAMYEAGVYSSAFVPNALVIGANPKNEPVHDAIQGFTDGFMTDHFVLDDKHVTTAYIGEEMNEGFEIEDSKAITMLYKDNKKKGIVVPICGGAANSFYRMIEMFEIYDREDKYIYMGVDDVKTSVFSFVSAVKHIDKVIELCIDQWMSKEGMPKHQSFGLESGYTETILTPFTETMSKDLKNRLPDDILKTIHAEAVRKEAEYEK